MPSSSSSPSSQGPGSGQSHREGEQRGRGQSQAAPRPGVAKTQAGTRGAGFNGSLVIGIAAQAECRSQKVFRAGPVTLS